MRQDVLRRSQQHALYTQRGSQWAGGFKRATPHARLIRPPRLIKENYAATRHIKYIVPLDKDSFERKADRRIEAEERIPRINRHGCRRFLHRDSRSWRNSSWLSTILQRVCHSRLRHNVGQKI